MPVYKCEATVTSAVTCTVEAASLEEAKQKFKSGDWEDYDEDGGEVQEVRCDLSTVELDTP